MAASADKAVESDKLGEVDVAFVVLHRTPDGDAAVANRS